MDESKPSISPDEFRLRSGSERTSADIDPPPAELAKSSEFAAVERQSRSGQIEGCRNDFSDGPSVAVYYRNEEEVRDGFFLALAAMGIAGVEQLPEPGQGLEDARFSIPASPVRKAQHRIPRLRKES
jgi:hypothetical protein